VRQRRTHVVHALNAGVLTGLALLCLSPAEPQSPAEGGALRLTATEAADMAAARSPMLQAASARAAGAWARERMAKSEGRLKAAATLFGVGATGSPMMISSGMVMPDDMFMADDEGPMGRAALRVTYPLYTGRRVQGMRDEARHNARAADQDSLETELEARLMAKMAYREVLLAQAMAEIAEQQVATLEEQVKNDRAKFEAGRLAEVDVLRQEAALAGARSQQAQARGMIAMNLADLKAELALSQSAEVSLLESLADVPLQAERGSLLALATTSRPAVRAFDERVLASRGALNAAEGTGRPSLQVVGTAGANVGRMGAMPQAAAGLALSVPISTGGATSAAKSEARAMIGEMSSERSRLILELDRDIAGLLAQYDAAAQQLGFADAQIAAAERAYEVTRDKYVAQRTIVVEVLDALRMRTEAYVERAMAAFRLQTTADRLVRTVGSEEILGAPKPLAMGWESLYAWHAPTGDVSLTVRDVTVPDFLAWLRRDQGVRVRVGDGIVGAPSLSGVFRSPDLAQAAQQALNAAGLRASYDAQTLTVGM